MKTLQAIYEASTAKTLEPKQRMNNLRELTNSYSESLKAGETGFRGKLQQAVEFAKKTKI